MTDFSQLQYSCAGGISTITFARPEVLNAFSRVLYQELADAVLAAEADRAVDVIVLTGAGRAFGTGGDLKEIARLYGAEDRVGLLEFADFPFRLFTTLETVSKPIVARVNGPAHAGALNVVLCSDLAIASTDANFRVPEALVGQADPFVATRLTLRVGLARAKAMMLTAETVDAKTAEAWGLVNRVVRPAQLDEAVAETVAAIRRTKPSGRARYKRLANASLPAFDLASLRECLLSADTGEGAQAFARGRTRSGGGRVRSLRPDL